jgi:hypothetical protein
MLFFSLGLSSCADVKRAEIDVMQRAASSVAFVDASLPALVPDPSLSSSTMELVRGLLASICAQKVSAESKSLAISNANLCIQNPPSTLAFWGLDSKLCDAYARRGVTALYDWQIEALCTRDVLRSHRNLIFAAPTSGGKTLVAELLMLRALLFDPRPRRLAFFLVPFVSIAVEKHEWFSLILRDARRKDLRCGLFAGSQVLCLLVFFFTLQLLKTRAVLRSRSAQSWRV